MMFRGWLAGRFAPLWRLCMKVFTFRALCVPCVGSPAHKTYEHMTHQRAVLVFCLVLN